MHSQGFQVPPAELESVLLTHPDVADAAVVGVESAREATELPRGYIVSANPGALKTDSDRARFASSVQEWIKSKVANHKQLRGGVVVIDVVPKRYVTRVYENGWSPVNPCQQCCWQDSKKTFAGSSQARTWWKRSCRLHKGEAMSRKISINLPSHLYEYLVYN